MPIDDRLVDKQANLKADAVPPWFHNAIKDALAPIKQDIVGIQRDVAQIQQDVAQIQQDISGIQQNVAHLKMHVTNIDARLICTEIEQARVCFLVMICMLLISLADFCRASTGSLPAVKPDHLSWFPFPMAAPLSPPYVTIYHSVLYLSRAPIQLPRLSSVRAIYNLSDDDTRTYFANYGGSQHGNPSIVNQKLFIGRAIGCADM